MGNAFLCLKIVFFTNHKANVKPITCDTILSHANLPSGSKSELLARWMDKNTHFSVNHVPGRRKGKGPFPFRDRECGLIIQLEIC